ncbi:MAG: hypothetical protein ACR2J8_09960, partial [Thermomicrobiales bacterium]
MTTRRSLLAASAFFAGAGLFSSSPSARAEDATPMPDALSAGVMDASVLLGDWKGRYDGYQRGEAFGHEVTFSFTDVKGNMVFGKQIIPQEDGSLAEEATALALLSDGHFIGADTDGLKFGSLMPDGSMNIIKVEAGMDDGAFFSVLRKDDQPAAKPAQDASTLIGRWVGTLDGFQQGAMTSGMREIDITEATGPAFTGSGIYKVGDSDWSAPGLTEGLIASDGRLYLINGEGYIVGDMLDENTMALAYLEVGMDNAAIAFHLHREEAKMTGGTPAPMEMAAIDLMGCWSGPAQSGTESGVREITFSDGKDGFFG